MTTAAPVILSHDGLISTITVNRPDALNALDRETLQALLDASHEIRERGLEKTRAVIFRGAGGKAFVAGADIKLMQRAALPELGDFISLGQTVMRRIEELPQVTIAAIDGFAFGGGLELALACDFIVATPKAKLGQAETKLGLIPGFGGTQRLGQRVSIGTLRKLVFLADPVGGEEGARIGLVDYLVPSEGLDAKLLEITQSLLARGPLAIASAKRCIDITHRAGLDLGLQKEIDEFLRLFSHQDTKEGLAAFVEKRAATFQGK